MTDAPGPLLEGKVAIVTGGAGGIGRGISEAFAAHGAAVVVVDQDEARLAETEDAIGTAGRGVLSLALDVTDQADVDRLVPAAVERFGHVDTLVNNVGHFVHRARPFTESTVDEWDDLYRLNLEHVLRCTRAVLPAMIGAATGGSVVNVSTVEAFRAMPNLAVYSAFKAGVTQFSKSLALEVGQHGVRVNDIAPDVIRTLQVPYDRWLSDEERELIPYWVPLGRLGEPEDCAGPAVFLASDLSSFITGTTLHVDGGTWAAGGWFRTRREGREWTNRPVDP